MKEMQNIVLTGFMGCGKSAVGEILARRLGMAFYDLDREIEKGENCTIPEIFDREGEACFRRLELQCLKRILTGDPASKPRVLALGGGALGQPGVLRIIRQQAVLIYLEVPVQTLFERLKKDKNRPMLLDNNGKLLDEARLRERIGDLLASRENDYRQADLVVSVQPGWSKQETTNEIIRLLEHHAKA